jgi:dihydrolipoamide dehydrogenase
MAQGLARLGLEVHGFDAGDRVGGLSDEKVSETARACLSEEFAIRLGVQVELDETPDGIAVECGGDRVTVDGVLVAVGRRPNVEGLGLETLGVPLEDHGMPEVDPNTTRIGDTPVLLAGDANGDVPLLHEGSDEGHIAGINAMSDRAVRLARRTEMSMVFCQPGIAAVGQREPEDCLVGERDFALQGRAHIMLENRGLLRVYAARTDGRLLGAQMAAPAAEHMAHLLSLAIGQDLTVHDVLRMPFYHPTVEEGLRTALREIARDVPGGAPSDLARCEAIGAEALE